MSCTLKQPKQPRTRVINDCLRHHRFVRNNIYNDSARLSRQFLLISVFQSTLVDVTSHATFQI